MRVMFLFCRKGEKGEEWGVLELRKMENGRSGMSWSIGKWKTEISIKEKSRNLLFQGIWLFSFAEALKMNQGSLFPAAA